MATLAELARAHTTLDSDAIDHLQRLARGWSMLADLCFGDLVLLAATTDGNFVVLGQMRPSTSQTLHHDDLVGRVVVEAERPVVGRSYRSGEIVEGEVALGDAGGPSADAGDPGAPRRAGDRGDDPRGDAERDPSTGRARARLRRDLRALRPHDRARRVPVLGRRRNERGRPRVGDGAIVLDASGRIEYASPNAVNALHRMGIHANIKALGSTRSASTRRR